jgi:uncharacterized membrane protein
MDEIRRLIGTTVLGGIVFLVPLVFLGAVLGKAFSIMKLLGKPLAEFLQVERTILGFAFVELLTGMLLVLVCLIAGLVARSEFARARRAKLDTWLLHLIPGYAWVKGITGNIQDTEAQEVLKPVLVRFDDQYQLAFEVDRNDSGLVAIFLPGAPDARSGSVSYVAEDRVSGLDTGFSTVVKSCKNLGRGSLQMLPT